MISLRIILRKLTFPHNLGRGFFFFYIGRQTARCANANIRRFKKVRTSSTFCVLTGDLRIILRKHLGRGCLRRCEYICRFLEMRTFREIPIHILNGFKHVTRQIKFFYIKQKIEKFIITNILKNKIV